MGCESCSNNGSGLPKGCKNNGACGVSGCNKLDVFDWLSGMELPAGQKPYDIVEVRFKNGRKSFYRNVDQLELQIGDVIAVESSPGHDVGIVSLTGELVKTQLQLKGVKDNHEVRKVYRKAKTEDVERWQEARKREEPSMQEARKIASELGLEMKISDIEFQGDGAKATFFYTAEDRVDFRELIRKFADAFGVRIEMRQIGMRQEAARLGGIGSCGRELCCSTWLTDFRSVSTSAARYQQLSLNPQKLAGQCGKLKCCLNFELDQYLEAVKKFPSGNTKLKTQGGIAFHFKTDIFKGIMYFIQQDQPGSSPVGIPVEQVKEIIAMNEAGEKPMTLMDFMVEEIVEKEEVYTNVVGQDSLTRFDQKKSRRKKPNKGKGPKRGPKRPEAKQGESGEKSNNNRPKRRKRPANKGNKPGAANPENKNPQAQGAKSGENNAPAKKKRRPQRRKPKGPEGTGGAGKPSSE